MRPIVGCRWNAGLSKRAASVPHDAYYSEDSDRYLSEAGSATTGAGITSSVDHELQRDFTDSDQRDRYTS